MKHPLLSMKIVLILISATLFVSVSGCRSERQRSSVYLSEIGSLREQLTEKNALNDSIQKNLRMFDSLHFTVFADQEWQRMKESHAPDVKVTWPDGHITTGLDKHVDDLKTFFVFAPDIKIMQHHLNFGADDATCVTGTMTGTFTVPMPIGFGKFIHPTGKSFALPMCTVCKWKNGLITEENLYWDNKAFMDQLEIE